MNAYDLFRAVGEVGGDLVEEAAAEAKKRRRAAEGSNAWSDWISGWPGPAAGAAGKSGTCVGPAGCG